MICDGKCGILQQIRLSTRSFLGVFPGRQACHGCAKKRHPVDEGTPTKIWAHLKRIAVA